MSDSIWTTSARKLKSVKYLALIASFIAMKIILGAVYIPVGENLHIGISYLIVALEAAIIGPVAGMASGFVTDILSFILFPNGPFFFGYTITAMLGEVCYAIFLYEKEVTVARLACAKIAINYIINVLIGSIWSCMLYSNGYIYYLVKSLIKNTLMLPIEILLMTALFNLVGKMLIKKKFLSEKTSIPLRLK